MVAFLHSLIFCGGIQADRMLLLTQTLTTWHISEIDHVVLMREKESIGIADIRQFQKRLILYPQSSPYTVGVIGEAHLLTTEAQNALLKTLEEPPPHARIILELDTADVLLPTVISRCQIVNIAGSRGINIVDTDHERTLSDLLQHSIGKQLASIDEVASSKDAALLWIHDSLPKLRRALIAPSTPDTHRTTIAAYIHKLLHAKVLLGANVNAKLVLDTVFYPSKGS